MKAGRPADESVQCLARQPAWTDLFHYGPACRPPRIFFAMGRPAGLDGFLSLWPSRPAWTDFYFAMGRPGLSGRIFISLSGPGGRFYFWWFYFSLSFGLPCEAKTASDLVFVPAHFGSGMKQSISNSKGFGDFRCLTHLGRP